MTIGNFIQLKKQTILSQITPGRIVNIYCDFVAPPHEKFIIIVNVQPNLLGFFINSDINAFKRGHQKIANTQLRILQQEHPFLDADSYVDCHSFVSKFTLNDLVDKITYSPQNIDYHIKCCISQQLKNDIITELRTSSFLIPIETDKCINALN